MNPKRGLIAAAGMMLTASMAFGLHAKLSLQEIAQNADLIFAGTVTRQNSHYNARRTAIETDVTFTNVSIEHESDRAQQRGARTIQLTYAGGRVGDVMFGVSDSPTFETGHRYLVFMNDDGSRPFNPVIGGFQGMFEVLSDPVARQEYLRTPGGRAVVGVDDDGSVRTTSRPLDSVSAGVPAFRTPAEPPVARAPDPEPVGPGIAAARRAEQVLDVALETPMTIDDFVDHVRNVSLEKKVDRPQLKHEQPGRFYRLVDGAIVTEPLERREIKVETIDDKLRRAGLSVGANNLGAGNAGVAVSSSSALWYEPLMNCGRRQSWPFTMEIPLDFVGMEFFAAYDGMNTYNNYVDLFRPIGAYPGWGWNGANEFLGFPSDDELIAAYGFGMGGSLALTISVAIDGWCNTIVESDIAWSRWENWTDNLFIALEPSNYARNINPVTMHELGHTVGLSRALPENYEHDYLTYMDGANITYVVEDGRGLHAAEAINLRANYGSSTNIADMGVESYYADTWTVSEGWLTSPGPDYGTNRLRTPLHPGDTFTANQLTVENMSQFAHSNVHIRLYLSTDPTINALDDREVGHWYFPTFWGDSYWEGDLTADIPLDMPPGTYWVGLWVTINGFIDDYSPNNKTFFWDRLTIENATITSFTPTSGAEGNIVTINGTNFTGATAVKFNGLDATSFTVVSSIKITAKVPVDATTGPITVTGPNLLATSTPDYFRVAPKITSIGPPSGAVGDFVFLQGLNFTGATTVKFNGTTATFDWLDDTLISTTVPANATTGKVTVTTAAGTGTSVDKFTVAPQITSFTPTGGPFGTIVTINGANFTGATAVKFNGMLATAFTVNSATKITATVPVTSTSGPIDVTTPAGTGTSTTNYTVTFPPTISSISPTGGAPGLPVTINGTNFTGASAVKFNGTSASFTVDSAIKITATVPSSATTGPITVTTPAGTATSANFTNAPRITSFTPTSGPYGTVVTINGANFTGATTVRFNGVAATTFTVNTSLKITATVPTGATTGLVGVTTAGGTGTSATPFTVTFLPTISNFTPTSGAPTSLVTITGTNYTGVSSVKFNGTTGSFTVNSPTQITATVPSLATTGPITVTTAAGTATSATNYTVAPRITSFTPTSGAVGASVSVNGANFTAATSVKFNGVTASFAVNTASSISATVPAGATTGKITVTTAVGTGTSGTNFTVKPAIASFTPTSGAPGVAVTITGTTFTGATAVKFNGVTASFIVNTSTHITATVPATATSGPITVTTPGGTATSAATFTVAPRITSFSPASGAVGASVVINGANFTGATSVKFGGTGASFVVNTAVKITATVPAGAVTGAMAVTTSAGTVVSGSNFTVLP